MNGRPSDWQEGDRQLQVSGSRTKITVMTWRDGATTTFTLEVDKLKVADAKSESVAIAGIITPGVPRFATSRSGTRVVLAVLKHKTPVDEGKLKRHSRVGSVRGLRGEMTIHVKRTEKSVDPHLLNVDVRFPETGFESAKLPSSAEVRYFYAFTTRRLSPPRPWGFTIYVTAAKPPRLRRSFSMLRAPLPANTGPST